MRKATKIDYNDLKVYGKANSFDYEIEELGDIDLPYENLHKACIQSTESNILATWE